MTPRAVLVGPPGAGKSTIGRRLAQALDVELLDTDAEIERRTGRTIPEIFETDGEPFFREIEEQVIGEALASHDGILSLGGGAILSERTRSRLVGHTVVYLEISVAEGLKRTGTSSGRPLLAGADPKAKYHALMRRRRPLYRQVATIRVRTDSRSPSRVVQQVVTKLTGGSAPDELADDLARDDLARDDLARDDIARDGIARDGIARDGIARDDTEAEQ